MVGVQCDHGAMVKPCWQLMGNVYLLQHFTSRDLVVEFKNYYAKKKNSPQNVRMGEPVHQLYLAKHLLTVLSALVHLEDHHFSRALVLHLQYPFKIQIVPFDSTDALGSHVGIVGKRLGVVAQIATLYTPICFQLV